MEEEDLKEIKLVQGLGEIVFVVAAGMSESTSVEARATG
jgi:hypothetical protein